MDSCVSCQYYKFNAEYKTFECCNKESVFAGELTGFLDYCVKYERVKEAEDES